ncbi:6-hydroxy-D-nicotine oxidase [Podospora fimiseda]|uniref:6-hydroxy-D-nicotine oxidase n=1 Tax=Podospora fimiseda TaxID=252190 RepID=A0AAN6YNF3_9PEZI|nr:6-hydroxy-D-nicotine oxidase [Podospora fimiseda]
MVKFSIQDLALAAGLFQGINAAPSPEVVELESRTWGAPPAPWFNFWDTKPLEVTTHDGKLYGCKCQPNQPCWPKFWQWNALNSSVNGNLKMHIPPAAVCYNSFQSPLGNFSTYDAAKCADVQANWEDEQWTVKKPGAALWTYFTNETCRVTTNPTDTCTLGYYGVYAVEAKTRNHIKATVDFARQNNIRLVIRNTGHDFLGRSVGANSLILNTHSFKDITWINSYSGPGSSYNGGAVKLGAGVQAKDILAAGHAQVPPKVIVTGECPTVGIAGGFIQGGGHGPWTPLKGMSADNVLAFEVLTASGYIVNANAVENPDLFWALKGGGPSSYGVLLSMTVKTFEDLPSAGATFYVNDTLIGYDNDVFWNATSVFHKWSNHFVDNGLYVYFEIFPFTLRARPFVAIDKTAAQLDALVAPMLAELTSKGIPFEYTSKEYPTFYQLYTDLFEAEAAAGSALTGGWLINHDDVANNNDGIIEAMKALSFPAPDAMAFMVGHLFNPGYGKPVADSSVHPGWRNATNFVITVVPVEIGATKARKAYLQDILTNRVDQPLRDASTSGATYANEADPYQPNWQGHFWGSNYNSLKTIRNKWDPKGIFYAIATPGTEDWEVIQDGNMVVQPTATTAVPSERTPLLLSNGNSSSEATNLNTPNSDDTQPPLPKQKSSFSLLRKWQTHLETRILLTGFLISLSFSYTQTPILYVFSQMQCQVYYETHPPWTGDPSLRCLRDEIAAGTATQFSLLGMSTTFFGTINLFVAGWMARSYGPKRALLVQTFVPALRVATQILGVMAGGRAGMVIIQCTQVITIVGGPVGYILVINVLAGELVLQSRRTVVFGMLQGCFMVGQGLGYICGGIIGDTWGIRRPFEVAFCSFILSTIYAAISVPYISPETLYDGKKDQTKGFLQLFAPLKVLVPQRILLQNGAIKMHYGVLLLCSGVFLGVVATGYAPLLIQLYAAAKFNFNQTDNGILTSGFAFMRGAFLLFAFPRIINAGRKWHMARHPEEHHGSDTPEAPPSPHLATNPEELEAPIGTLVEEEPVASDPVKEDEGTGFDLFFLRNSLLVDGLLTMCTAFATEWWHIYLAAFLLPLASGTAPAAKGVMTEMCPPSKRADALNALTLVENIARLTTQGLFGFVFSALAGIGKAHLTFFANAAIALIAFAVLLLPRFKPEGSKILEDDGEVSEETPLTNGRE